jgi:hypothetical protein
LVKRVMGEALPIAVWGRWWFGHGRGLVRQLRQFRGRRGLDPGLIVVLDLAWKHRRDSRRGRSLRCQPVIARAEAAGVFDVAPMSAGGH